MSWHPQQRSLKRKDYLVSKKDSSSWQNSGLEFEGEPPESVKEMERKNLAEGNNLFEVPVDLFVSIVGYHYMDDDCTFEELQSTQ